VRPIEANQTLVIDGNLFVDGGGDPVVPTLGVYQVLVKSVVPVQAQGISTSGSTGPTASEIALAVLAAMNDTPPSVNMTKVRGQAISGSGSESDPWGPG
jgi:hypothetical protein